MQQTGKTRQSQGRHSVCRTQTSRHTHRGRHEHHLSLTTLPTTTRSWDYLDIHLWMDTFVVKGYRLGYYSYLSYVDTFGDIVTPSMKVSMSFFFQFGVRVLSSQEKCKNIAVFFPEGTHEPMRPNPRICAKHAKITIQSIFLWFSLQLSLHVSQ